MRQEWDLLLDEPETTARRCLTGLVCLVIVWGAAPAAAQDVARRETVMNRQRPEVDAIGVRAGGFLLYPRAGVELQLNDNVYAEPANEVDDSITVLTPGITAESSGEGHWLSFGAEAEIGRYSDEDSEDYEDFQLRAEGRRDLGRGRIEGRLRHYDLHEDRSSPDDCRVAAIGQCLEPTELSIDSLAGAWQWQPSRLLLRFAGEYERFDYEDNGAVNNDDRDRDEITAGARTGYEMSPDYNLWVEIRSVDIDYDELDNGVDRSSDGYDLVVGSTMDFSGRTFGEVFAGYRRRDYDAAQLEDSDGATFGADLTWNVTGLTTLNFLASQEVNATTVTGASGIDTTTYGVSVDHELLRNLIVSASLSDVTEDYEGVARDDDVMQAGFTARYLMNRRLHVTLGYDISERDTSPPNPDEYDRDVMYLRLDAQI